MEPAVLNGINTGMWMKDLGRIQNEAGERMTWFLRQTMQKPRKTKVRNYV